MALRIVEGLHVRVTCDACHRVTAELCGKRELEVSARQRAVINFRRGGWHHDAAAYGRAKGLERADVYGSGKWYCPECAKQTHL